MIRALLLPLTWTILAAAPPLAAAQAAAAPAPQNPPATAPAPAPARRPQATGGASGGGRPVNVTVSVTDGAGLGIPGVRVIVTGPVTRDGTTVADGSFRALGLKPGNYRFRFEQERFVTLERDVTVRSGQPADVDVMLTRAADKAPPEPTPAPTPAPAERTMAPLKAGAFDITSYLEKDYLKSGPSRVKSISCSDSDSVDVVQTTSSYAVPAGKHQLVVVAIAGAGRASIGGQSYRIDSRSGSTLTVPPDTAFEATREGKNTLVFVLVSVGEGCKS